MPKFLVLGSCVTAIPFFYEIFSTDHSAAIDSVRETMKTKTGLTTERVVIQKVLEIEEDDPKSVSDGN